MSKREENEEPDLDRRQDKLGKLPSLLLLHLEGNVSEAASNGHGRHDGRAGGRHGRRMPRSDRTSPSALATSRQLSRWRLWQHVFMTVSQHVPLMISLLQIVSPLMCPRRISLSLVACVSLAISQQVVMSHRQL